MKKPNLSKLICLIVLLSGCQNAFEPEPSNTPEANFESIWSTFNERYAVFGQRGVNWEDLYSEYRPMINANTSDAELFEVVTEMLSMLDDAHVSLMATDRPFWSGKEVFRSQTGRNLFNYDVVRTYLDSTPTVHYNQYITGKIVGEIGYLWVASLADNNPDFIDDFITNNQTSTGIIIDLRHNDGGDFINGFEIAARFADMNRLAFVNTPKAGPGNDQYGDSFEYYLEPKGPKQFTGPIVVLINNYSVSAAESLALYLRPLPYVTFLGINTAGAVGERIEKEMPNGWIYSLTAQLVTLPDGTSPEGPGVSPDIEVVNTLAELQSGMDTQLEEAINYLSAINP